MLTDPVQFLPQHLTRDQDYPLLSAIKTSGIFFRVFTDYCTWWNDATPINDDFA